MMKANRIEHAEAQMVKVGKFGKIGYTLPRLKGSTIPMGYTQVVIPFDQNHVGAQQSRQINYSVYNGKEDKYVNHSFKPGSGGSYGKRGSIQVVKTSNLQPVKQEYAG